MSITEEFKDYIKRIIDATGESAVEAAHQPTNNERNNLVYIFFSHILGIKPRIVDYAVIESMANDIENIADLKLRYIPAVAEIIWDHFLGEPEEPCLEDITKACLALTDAFYTLTEEVRNDINDYAGQPE